MNIIQSGVFHANIDDNGNAEILSYNGNSANVLVPDEINGYKVTKLGDELFNRHEEIQTVTLPDSLEIIGQYAFATCTRLTKPIILPVNVREIHSYAFYHYPLSEIELSTNLATIQYHAFTSAMLSKIIIPDSVKKIGGNAFCNTLIEAVLIPDSVEILDSSAFEKCRHLQKILIGAGIRDDFQYGGFHDCTALKAIYVSSKNEYLCDIDGVLFDKAITRLIKYPARKNLESYAIPETVTKICIKAFEYANVKRVICPDRLKEIASAAFSNSALQYINIPDSIEYIDVMDRHREESWYCLPLNVDFEISENNPHYKVTDGKLTQKKTQTYPTYTEPIEKTSGIFCYCEPYQGKAVITRTLEKPEYLVIPEVLDGLTVFRIRQAVFGYFFKYYCPRRIRLPKTIEEAFTGDMFSYMNDLIECIDVDDDNPNISSHNGVLFQNAKPDAVYDKWTLPGTHGLTLTCYPMRRRSDENETYRIPDGTETIGRFAFYHANYLKRVIIPPSVKLIKIFAFRNCLSLEEILFEDGCKTNILASAFSNNPKLTKVVIPKNVTKIHNHAVDLYQSPPPVIYGVKDSMAEYYAVKNQFTFVLM